MAKIIWLASYPKSGNTWMRILLTNYRSEGKTPADINKLEGGPIAGARTWFDEWSGLEASALADNVIERLRPAVYRCMAGENRETLYMKVHDAWGRTDRREAIFPADITAGVVYIMRNPLDLVASCANHWGVGAVQAVDYLCDPDFAMGCSRDALLNQLRQHLGSWSNHVLSWLDESGLPVHLVRYEDLRRDPLAVFGEVVRFCGLPFAAARAGKAVAFSDFAEVQRQERVKGFRERSTASSAPFFRRGQAGAWREELAPDLVERIIATHGPVMRRFGYLDEAGRPV